MMMQEMDATSGSLWSIANASNAPQSVANMPNAASWTSPLGEMVLKIDGKLKVSASNFAKFFHAHIFFPSPKRELPQHY